VQTVVRRVNCSSRVSKAFLEPRLLEGERSSSAVQHLFETAGRVARSE